MSEIENSKHKKKRNVANCMVNKKQLKLLTSGVKEVPNIIKTQINQH